MCEKRSKPTQGCVMSPWQVESGAVLDVGEQRSSLRKRSRGTPLPIHTEKSHAETERAMINACRERGQGEKKRE